MIARIFSPLFAPSVIPYAKHDKTFADKVEERRTYSLQRDSAANRRIEEA
jgi:hypothetical protein